MSLDYFFASALVAANSKDVCIRYMTRLHYNEEKNKLTAQVSLKVLPLTHAFASLTPCDNIFQISSQW